MRSFFTSKLLLLIMILVFSLCACSDKGEWRSPHAQSPDEQWVAHAGGRINGMNYTNSVEALHTSYQSGIHLVELDFEWTQDGHLVLLHDWDKAPVNIFKQNPGQRTLAQFNFFKTSSTLTPMTAQELFIWLDAHPNLFIITDIKSNVLKALMWIQEHYPFYSERFIPQIYYFEEYEPVRKLGYNRVILTLYRIRKKKDDEILNFCKTHPVWAVTMPDTRVRRGTLTKDLRTLNIPVYAHTVNDPKKIKILFSLGVFGIYSDKIDLAAHINKATE